MLQKIVKICLKAASYVIVGALIAILIFNAITMIKRSTGGEQLPTVLGFGSAIVLTGSMEPEISPDDMVIIHKQESYALRDVITYEGNTTPVTHRIIEVKTDESGALMYKTQGDANNTDDGYISAEKVIGRVILVIPSVGGAQRFLQSPAGFLLITLIAGALLFLPDIFSIKSKNSDKQNKNE